MRFDNLIIRLTAVLGPEWQQAYALIDLQPNVDIDIFRFKVPSLLKYHHETEKLIGGIPGDLFIGFFVKGQQELFEQIGAIKAMKEVREVKEWAIANFPVGKPEMTTLDWKIVKSLRGGAEKTSSTIAKEIAEDATVVEKRLQYIKSIPLAFSIEPPNEKQWSFAEIQMNFYQTTFAEVLPELLQVGKPFGATNSRIQATVMVEPKTVEEFKEQIKKVASIKGVKIAGYAFCEDMIWSQPWLDKFIDEQIAKSA